MKALVIEELEGGTLAVSVHEFTNDNSLQVLQKAVGGNIEAIPTSEAVTMWVNDEGKYNGCRPNYIGTATWAEYDEYGCIPAGDYVSGPLVVTGPCDDEGYTTGIPDDILCTLLGLLDCGALAHA